MSAHIGSKDRAHVMTAKAALVGFSRALAHDLAADRITANCVVPGAIDTTRPGTSPSPAHHLTHGTITGERGKPDDVAAMVRFLCGPGGRYVTGQTIHVNGGAYLGVVVAGRALESANPPPTVFRCSNEVPMYSELALYIDGKWLNGEGRKGEDVINPATGKTLAHLPHASTADLDAALEAAAEGLRGLEGDLGL